MPARFAARSVPAGAGRCGRAGRPAGREGTDFESSVESGPDPSGKMMKGSLDFFRGTLWEGKDRRPRRSNRAGRVPPWSKAEGRVPWSISCNTASRSRSRQFPWVWRGDRSPGRQLFGMGMNSNGRGRTRLNDRSARERASAEHAALPRAPTHDPTPTRDRERLGQTMKTISCPLPGGFSFAA
jgi:hypothetical protein